MGEPQTIGRSGPVQKLIQNSFVFKEIDLETCKNMSHLDATVTYRPSNFE